MDGIPQPILISVIVTLGGVIALLFRLLIGQHSSDRADWRAERKEFMDRMKNMEGAMDRQSTVELMRFCVSPHVSQAMKEEAEKLLKTTPQ